MVKFKIPKIKMDQEPTLREKVFYAIAILALLFVFVNFFWSPQGRSLRVMHVELNGLELQADAVKKLIDATQAQISKQEKEPKAPAGIDEHVKRLLDRRVSDVADEINSTADLLGNSALNRRVKIKKVAVGDRVEKTGYSVVPIDIELSGPYTGVGGYFEAIENLDRPLIIKSFDIGKSPESQGVLEAKLEVELYVVKR